MVRDAEQDDLAVSFPFPKMRWPEEIVPGPSPFAEEERDKILGYFSARRWKVGGFNETRPHYPYFAFLYTLLFTSMRPSELVAVRVGSVNLHARTLQVGRSHHLGAEAAPKTLCARGGPCASPTVTSRFRSPRSNSRRSRWITRSRMFGTNQSSRRTFTICFVMCSARTRSHRCAIPTQRKALTFRSRSPMT